MNKPPISSDLLQKYLNNECTDQEKEAVEEWYASLKGIPDYLETLPVQERNHIKTETLRRIREQLAPVQPVPALPATHRVRSLGWWLGAAASVVVVAGLWFAYTGQRASDVVTAEVQQPPKESLPSTGIVRFVNEEPRMVMHQLPDGSTVWMHAEASITYPRSFAEERRLVTFEGEGFFDVKSDKKRPFTIQSGDMRVEVLGTRFNVKAPPKQLIYEVSVVSGSVAVSTPANDAASQKVVLAPKQQALFETRTRRLTSNTIPAEPKKEIYEPVTVTFESTPLKQAIEQLSQRYDVRVHLVNPDMNTCRLTADFEQQPLPAILEMLCATLDATYTMSGKTIMIEGEPCE
ncbi:FecR family protein [Telluribacter sp.]|jgi:hypothetical protein|uniref:FecR family protein n=1 Tax=Telluribacter sp. TaxID=1978767 RepID=UPI002E14B1FE|nr:FecR domain-containing protein [Telluribacter sp.]